MPKTLPDVKSIGQKRPVTVVGAGFSGLTAAFYLSRAGFQVEVIEESSRVGGMIQTVRTPFGLVETAANGLLNSARVEELFRFMNLEVTPTLREARRRYIFRKGLPRRWPVGLGASFRALRFVCVYFLSRSRVKPRQSETVRTWAERVLGRENSQYLVEAALQGIYAGDPARLSASLIFGGMFSRGEKPARPRIRGTVSAPDGMGELMQRLRAKLEEKGVRFLMEQKFASPERAPLHPHVLATSAPAAAAALSKLDHARSRALGGIELLPIVTATVSFRDAPPDARGFGCLFPPAERRTALGVLMNNFIFPHRAIKGFCETWIFGGAISRGVDVTAMSDSQITDLAAEERQATLNTSGEVIGSLVTRWPKALPHYTWELENTLPELQGLRQNVVLIGNYLGQIGLAKILERASRLPEEIHSKGDWGR